MRRFLPWTLLAVLAGLVVAVASILPPAAVQVDLGEWDRRLPGTVVRGAYHVHTNRSDGTGSVDQVAAAAARAGLDFVILTDHGDGTEAPLPPSFRSGVLCIDAVEISTSGGHYVGLGLGRAPYRLAGDAREVVEDVARLGGMGIAAHPDSAKKALRWLDWSLPIDGFEWLNADSEWRDESRGTLTLSALTYVFRGPEVIASLFDRPDQTLARWDTAGRPLVALAGLDAHARLGPRGIGEDPDATRAEWGEGLALPVPSYESTFRSLTTRVELDAKLPADPEAAADQVLDAIRRGRVFTVVDALAGPGDLEFSATRPDGAIVRMGARIDAGGAPLEFLVRAAAPPSARVVLRRNGAVLAENTGTEVRVRDEPGADGLVSYRAEVYLPSATGSAPVPWMLGNAIYVGRGLAPEATPPDSGADATDVRWLYRDEEAADWRLERDADSVAAVSTVPATTGRMLVLRFGLASGKKDIWAALVRDLVPPLADARRLRFRARANQPTRLSVQVRSSAGGADGLRWRRSVYLDETDRDVSVEFGTMSPVERGMPADVPGTADAILLVVDGVHARPGSTGIIWFDDVRLER